MTRSIRRGYPFAAALFVLASVPLRAQEDVPSANREAELRMSAGFVAVAVPAQNTSDLRPNLSFDASAVTGLATWHLDTVVEGLARRNGPLWIRSGRVRVRDAWVEGSAGRVDVRAGYGRLVWGRLDEISPSDVLNPIDAGRFLVEGRSAARLPVAFARGRFSAGERIAIEAVVLPIFRRATFDELDEETSPFNLTTDMVWPAQSHGASVVHVAPRRSLGNVSGGGRLQMTAGRVDAAVTVFRGFDGFGPVTFEVSGVSPVTGAVVGALVERHTRMTMLGFDAETVIGAWAIRGEAVGVTERSFAGGPRPGLVSGRSFDAGIGVDRRLGEVRVFTSVLVHRDWSAEDASINRTDVSVVGSIERGFGRDEYLARGFAVINPQDGAAFTRVVFQWRPRDALSLEASGGWFAGTGNDTISRFAGRDFLSLRLRCYF